MKNNRKLLAMILALVMAASLFGCARDSAQPPVPLVAPTNGGKNVNDPNNDSFESATEERTLSTEALSIAFDTLPNIAIYNYSEKTRSEIYSQQNAIVAQINYMQTVAEEELRKATSDIEANQEDLPITVEVVAICEDFTYIFSAPEGSEPYVLITESNIVTLSEAEISELSSTESFYDSEGIRQDAIDTESQREPSIRGVSGTCTGPCIKDCEIAAGIGSRLPLSYSGGATKLSFSVKSSSTSTTVLPKNSSGTLLSGGCDYLYGGFKGTTTGNEYASSDIGFAYNKLNNSYNEYGWRLAYVVQCGSTFYRDPSIKDQNGNGGQVWGGNGYKPGETIDVEIRIDTSPVNSSLSRVIMVTDGWALHSDSSGNGGLTKFIQHTYCDTKKINSPDSWKLLATCAYSGGPESDMKYAFVTGLFTGIKINGNKPTTFQNTENDHGYAVKYTGTDDYFLQACIGTGY